MNDPEKDDAFLSLQEIPFQDNPIRKLMLDYLHPSEMTPEERMDELAAILAMGFLRLKAGMHFPRESR